MVAFPKPAKRIVDKMEQRRTRESQAQRFRSAVWARDEGKCRWCVRRVIRTLELVPNRGEVHHRHGRNVRPEDRYRVNMAVLLCARCHADPNIVQYLRTVDAVASPVTEPA